VRSLLADAGLAPPDEVAHWSDAVAFYWHDTKAVVIIDLDEVDLDDLSSWDPVEAFAPLDPLEDFTPWATSDGFAATG
jgi:hypothetical protein